MAGLTLSGIRLTSMNPITKALLACAAVCIALYFLISEFLGSTENLKDSLDVKSLAYTRPAESDKKAEVEPELLAQSVDPVEEAPERELVEERIDAASVLTVSEEDANKDSDEDEESSDDETESEVDEEQSASASAEARLKEALGIEEPLPPVRAVDVAYELPQECDASSVLLAPVTVKYRFESPTISGASLSELELLMNEYRRCEGGEFLFAHNPLGKEDATPLLMQRRLDELKYFFLQHRVPKAALRFPDDS